MGENALNHSLLPLLCDVIDDTPPPSYGSITASDPSSLTHERQRNFSSPPFGDLHAANPTT
ncbi:unnamed protein product [Citrullus colocynthis]|uniref:Uncharacterized protein n=1 Tax=Citrullus colocynthis TaxID=252529 RepID=A0ABP0Y4R0_9ROSI